MNKESAVRSKILNVASRLFYRQGYHSTGINQVITESDIARASLYNHFPTKEALLNSYLEEKDAGWFIALETFLSKRKGPREKLLGIFDFRIQRQEEQDFGGCPFVKISNEVSPEENSASEIVKRHKTRLLNYIIDLVQQLDDDNKALNRRLLPETIYFLMEGATVNVNIYKSSEPIRQAKKIASRII